ncbi:hypothetical protein [Deinococcus gobiensis]|uniref:hypothetical protein n=1 Tax=Deinococcus gobiensis TaxID=502394 RepID=UPI0011AEBFB9|nr:hypothetical protein [Deinococcus gobiensis]
MKYASVGGVLTGKKPGDTVEIHDAEELKHLLTLGLIETEEEAEARALAAVGAHDAAKDSPAFTALTDEERLKPYAKGGGWYHFAGEGGVLTKLRREEALAKLTELEAAAHAAGDIPPQ